MNDRHPIDLMVDLMNRVLPKTGYVIKQVLDDLKANQSYLT